ncbi:MAG: putative quinol monooxygenase [Pyrinomonadaceae bacterium]
MSTKTVRVVARVTSKPDKIDQVRGALMSLVPPTRAEDECVAYELLQNNEDPTDFTFVEEWSSDASLDEHLQTDHFKFAAAKLDGLLDAPPDIRRYTSLI